MERSAANIAKFVVPSVVGILLFLERTLISLLIVAPLAHLVFQM